MLAEKQSLRRFLLFYLSSTFLLVGMGEYLYYLFARNKIVEEEKYFIKSELRFYLSKNPSLPDIVKLRELKKKGIFRVKIAVYKNNRYVYGDFKPQKVYFNNEFWTQGSRVYFLLILPKNWGKIYVLCSKEINRRALYDLYRGLLLFSLFSMFFISLSAFVLGKIFLRPMREAIKSMEEFLDDVTHEMNTPLSIILNNIEILELKKMSSTETERIKLASLRLNKLFKDLVYIKFNKRKKKTVEEFDLKDMINDRLVVFSLLIENKRLSIVKKLKSLKVRMDREDALRVIDNVVSNAIKYSPRGTEVVVSLNVKEARSLVIENEGYIKNSDKITKKFVREDHRSGGLGLGLYIVERVCREYDLKFNLDSSNSIVSVKIDFSQVAV